MYVCVFGEVEGASASWRVEQVSYSWRLYVRTYLGTYLYQVQTRALLHYLFASHITFVGQQHLGWSDSLCKRPFPPGHQADNRLIVTRPCHHVHAPWPSVHRREAQRHCRDWQPSPRCHPHEQPVARAQEHARARCREAFLKCSERGGPNARICGGCFGCRSGVGERRFKD